VRGWRSLYRLPAVCVVLATGAVGAWMIGLVHRNPLDQRRARARWVHRVTPWISRAVGASVTSRTAIGAVPTGAGMTVANHISYVDVFLIAAQLPVVFVTSTEIRDTPVLGLFCRLAGCVFVDRQSARALRTQIHELAELMRDGVHIVVFPETTTSHGNTVLPFKAALFEAVRLSGRPLWVACIEYPAPERRTAAYVDDDTFAAHLIVLVSHPGIASSITWIAHEPEPARLDARALAHWSREAVVSAMAGAPSE